MPTIRTKDDIYIDVPDGMALDAPEVREAVEAERAGRRKRRVESPEFKAKVEEQRAKDRATYDPTKDMSTTDKTLANLGAGFDNLLQGAKQLIPGMKGMSDDELREKRAMDERLAESQQSGVGSDWMPSTGKALQFAGEVAPTLAIPGGRIVGTGAKMLPRAVHATFGGPVRAGIVGGAASGALMPVTSDESRAANTIIGGGLGGVLPGALQAGRKLRGMATGERRAGQQLLKAAGDDVAGLEADYAKRQADRAAMSPAVRAVPESLSEATGSVPMARLESQLGRAEATQDEMAAFLRSQNEARYNAALGATREADQLAGRDAVRSATTDPMREGALAAAGRDDWFHVPAMKVAEDVLQSPSGVNPAVKKVARYVLDSMGEKADGPITPARLYEVRKVLAHHLEAPTAIGDEMSAAVKGAQRETVALIKGIDAALDQASGGRWQPYLDTYKRASRGVDEARSAQEVREVLTKQGQPLVGETPELGRGRLKQAIEAARGGKRDFPLQMSPSAAGTMDDLMRQIQRAEEPTRTRKLAGTRGGGSQTSTDLDAVLRHLAQRSPIPGLSFALEAVGGRIGDATKRELADLMMDPPRAMAAIREAQRLNQPLSEAQTFLLNAASRGAAGALPRAMQQQQQPRY